VNPHPQYGTPAGEATLAIRKIASRSGGDVQELMTLYALEGLLARFALSAHRGDFVLKGGVLLAAYAARRPTRDIDLLSQGLFQDEVELSKRVHEILQITVDDGLTFNDRSVSTTAIRDDEENPGIRIKLTGQLGTAQLRTGLDISFGDPIWPAPEMIDLPRLVDLGLPPLRLLGYPLTMVLAEKIVTALDRGTANTRWRDFADIYTLSRHHTVDGNQFRRSLETVALHRHVSLQPLFPLLLSMPGQAQARYSTWRTRAHREAETPERFAQLLNAVAQFTDPVLQGSSALLWTPEHGEWK